MKPSERDRHSYRRSNGIENIQLVPTNPLEVRECPRQNFVELFYQAKAHPAEKIHDLTFRHYQRLESGEENPTLSTVERLMAAFPDTDFSLILKQPYKVRVA